MKSIVSFNPSDTECIDRSSCSVLTLSMYQIQCYICHIYDIYNEDIT